MKKFILLAVFFTFCVLEANAQLQVWGTNGNVWLKNGSNLSFGVQNTSNNFAQWDIEHWNGGLNFWKPYGSNNSGNYKFFIKDNGKIGIGGDPNIGSLQLFEDGDNTGIAIGGSGIPLTIFRKDNYAYFGTRFYYPIFGGIYIYPGFKMERLGKTTLTTNAQNNEYSFITPTSYNNSRHYAVKLGSSVKFYVEGDGDLYAKTAYRWSDQTLKKDITPITNSLEKIIQLNIFSYRYIEEEITDHPEDYEYVEEELLPSNFAVKDYMPEITDSLILNTKTNNGKNPGTEEHQDNRDHDKNKGKHDNDDETDTDAGIEQQINSEQNRKSIGVMAQDVEAILPEAVRTGEDGYKAVSYDQLTTLLIGAVKELNVKVETNTGEVNKVANLETELNTYKQLTNTQKSQIGAMQKQISNLEKTIVDCCNNKTKGNANKSGSVSGSSINETGEIIESTVAQLFQNTPNPFNQDTKIVCYIPDSTGKAVLNIYNLQGMQIKSIKLKGTGNISSTLSASEFHPGMYLYTLIIDNKEIDTKKMIITAE